MYIHQNIYLLREQLHNTHDNLCIAVELQHFNATDLYVRYEG